MNSVLCIRVKNVYSTTASQDHSNTEQKLAIKNSAVSKTLQGQLQPIKSFARCLECLGLKILVPALVVMGDYDIPFNCLRHCGLVFTLFDKTFPLVTNLDVSIREARRNHKFSRVPMHPVNLCRAKDSTESRT